jgi:hypothetical protein
MLYWSEEAPSTLDAISFSFDRAETKSDKPVFRKVIPIAQFPGGSVEHSAGEELRRFDPGAACDVPTAAGLSVELHDCGCSSSRKGGK